MSETIETPVETPVNLEEAAAQVEIRDIAQAAQIIDLAVKRGAFNAEEAAIVGANWAKLDKCVKAWVALNPAPVVEGEDAPAVEAVVEEPVVEAVAPAKKKISKKKA